MVIASDQLAGGTLVSADFRIDGRDHDLAGALTDSVAVAGIVTTQAVRDFALAHIPAGRLGNITGAGPAPDILVEAAGLNLDSLVAVVLAHPGLTTFSGTAPSTLGTETAPAVVYASSRLELPTGFRGVGVLVADHSVHFADGAEWRGLVVVRGEKPELRVRGTGTILGGAVLTGGPVDLRLYDSARILRSAAALGLAQAALDSTS